MFCSVSQLQQLCFLCCRLICKSSLQHKKFRLLTASAVCRRPSSASGAWRHSSCVREAQCQSQRICSTC
jgi:hypothetical protein